MGVDWELIRKTKLDVSEHTGICLRCGCYIDLTTNQRLEEIKHVRGILSHRYCNVCQVIIKQEVNQELAEMKNENVI